MPPSIMRLASARRWHRYSRSREYACYSIRLATRSACSTEESKADGIRDAASRRISAPRMPIVVAWVYALSLCEQLATEFSSAFAA
jgi:hypothetical protein